MTEIGRISFNYNLLPVLNIGLIIDFLRMLGNLPLLSNSFINSIKGAVMSLAIHFKVCVFNLSKLGHSLFVHVLLGVSTLPSYFYSRRQDLIFKSLTL